MLAAGGYPRTQGINERCNFVGGDFLTSVPKGGDAYFFASVASAPRLIMMVSYGDDATGWTEAEFARLLKPSEFEVKCVVPTVSEVSLLERASPDRVRGAGYGSPRESDSYGK